MPDKALLLEMLTQIADAAKCILKRLEVSQGDA